MDRAHGRRGADVAGVCRLTQAPAPPVLDVIVIGAGIAGLTAAHRLQQRGRRVVVLEAQDHVGGRMASERLEGHVIDRGAQFLSSGYAVIPRLLQELGLADHVRATSRRCAIVRDGRPRVLRIDRPVDAWFSGLLSLRALLRIGWHAWRAGRVSAPLSLSDYADWARFDDQTTRAWVDRHCGREACDYFFEPILQGFYFQSPEETSRALALAISNFGFRKAATTTLEGGLGQLPDAIAQGLDVRLGTTVNRVEEVGGRVRVTLPPSGALEAAHVVVAVPAPVSRAMVDVSALGKVASDLLATPYSASIVVTLLTDAQFRLPAALADVYGLLIPATEREHVAAVGIETNKRREHGGAGHLLNLLFCHQSAERCMQSADHVLVAQAIRSVESLMPSLSRHVLHSRVFRWPCAEPISWVGRARAIDCYRKMQASNPTSIVLAGDYMGMPFTEGAAESGDWAAQSIAGSSTPRSIDLRKAS